VIGSAVERSSRRWFSTDCSPVDTRRLNATRVTLLLQAALRSRYKNLVAFKQAAPARQDLGHHLRSRLAECLSVARRFSARFSGQDPTPQNSGRAAASSRQYRGVGRVI
jgi:hypothetical protein